MLWIGKKEGKGRTIRKEKEVGVDKGAVTSGRDVG